jgi:dTDP-4-dehydrorhamnose reductase
MKKILITGFTGMLGRSIVKKLVQNESYELFGVARKPDSSLNNFQQLIGDLTDDLFINSLQSLKPDIIIHTTALVDLNLCETNNQIADKLNAEAGRSLATLFPEARFIYISTDSVFDGKEGDYDENMQTNPLNYYALTKLEGEKRVLNSTENALILRTNIYGHKMNGKSLFDWAYQQLAQNKPLKGFDDVYFNPLYTEQVAEIIDTVIKDFPSLRGVFHLGCEEKINKYEFIKLISEVFQFNQQLIEPVSIKAMQSKVKRPLNTTLNTSKFVSTFRQRYSIKNGLQSLKLNLKAA